MRWGAVAGFVSLIVFFIAAPLAAQASFDVALEGDLDTMTFNGEEIRLIPYPGIHTDADLLVHFTGSGVVHIGDLLILQSFPSVTRRAGDYLEFLETVVDVFPESTRFICGHGREGIIADVAEYHRQLSAAAEIIKSSLAEGMTKRAILEDPALQTFENWGEFIPVLNTEYWVDAGIIHSLKVLQPVS